MEAGKGVSRSNIYFVRSGESWVLIDAASPDCGRLIQKAAASLFGANARPIAILLTHDHAKAALELARAWGCPVYLHPDELPLVVERGLSAFEKFANPMDRWIILPILHLMPHRRLNSILSKASFQEVAQHSIQGPLFQTYRTGSVFPRQVTPRAMLFSSGPVTVF